MQSRTIDVPKEILKRSVMQYVHAEAQKLEKRFRCGMDEDDRTTFEQYAESWLKRQTHYKPSTLAGYQRELKIVYPYIGGICLLYTSKLELQLQSSRKAIKDQMLRVRAGKGLPMCSFLGRSGIHSGGAAVIHLDAVNFRSVG